MMRGAALSTVVLLSLLHLSRAAVLDALPGLQNRTVLDSQLQDVLSRSIGWLEFRAEYTSYPKLHEYAEVLGNLVRPSCINCIDYFEALGILRSLGKVIKELIDEDKDDVFMPVIRRSYVAAVWTLQRSKLFKWEFTHFQSNALSTMYRLYMQHVKRAKGKAVSFHHISKCGGTTMCQLAATNRCSNPHLNIDKNCVLIDRLDGPIWMVAHDVNDAGAFPNTTIGALDVEMPENMTLLHVYSRRGYASEPRLPMWLMYSCPWNPLGRQYTCPSRMQDVQVTGTTFLANERTLATEFDIPQVCPEFVNSVILREPVPHAVSLMAEVKYRYVRQLIYRHNITSWQPPAWNLTWWETLGPALVGGYSTRTLIGRASFCRSAANMTQQELSEGVFSLLSFDLVMTLSRSKDIDLMISTMLGWPARNFSSQPASRVRDFSVTLATPPPREDFGYRRRLQQSGWPLNPGSLSSTQQYPAVDADSAATGGNSAFATAASFGGARLMLAVDSSDDDGGDEGQRADGDGSGDDEQDSDDRDEEEQPGAAQDSRRMDESDDDAFAAAAAALDDPFPDTPPPPAIPPEVIEAAGAVELVRKSWLERQAALMGFANLTAALQVIKEPIVQHTQKKTKHGAHVVQVTVVKQDSNNLTEVWHAFPRHAFAFVESDIQRLERLTWVDTELVKVADLLLDLDVGLLGSLLENFHYRRKMKTVATTYTACGFAGMMPVKDTIQRHVFF